MIRPVQASTTTPNFTARLKETDELKALVNKMNTKEKVQYGLALAKLSTTHIGETLELRPERTKDGIPLLSSVIVNTKDESKRYHVGEVFDTRRDLSGDRIGPTFFIETLKSIATEGEYPHKAVFHDPKEDAAKYEKERQKAKKDVIDLLA